MAGGGAGKRGSKPRVAAALTTGELSRPGSACVQGMPGVPTLRTLDII